MSAPETVMDRRTDRRTDPLRDVHHHSWVEYRGMSRRPALCGVVLPVRPDAYDLPCCPMCAELLTKPCITEVTP